ncbi:hypothetical protein [Clostridium omnivorum]|uniref:Uncharacterized protein n=1 Tax=Clostridium omnivorum TaxID=1604902 RepID=A0ABQ5NBI4_9CLOT|nr:hypothetical protein [Clostridium sp. E14]GLC32625.1 hypothetical protein bsdE14_40350 [Clostridium sp. E14]
MKRRKSTLNIDSLFTKFIFLAITIIAAPIHELGHLIGWRLDGIPAKLHFNYTDAPSNSTSLLGFLGGPLISLILALAGYILVYAFKKKRTIFIGVYFTITMCLTRLIPYLYSIILGAKDMLPINDEGVLAKILNMPIWQTYSIFTILFVSILLLLKYIHKDIFNKCFKYAFVFYLIVAIFQIKII